MVKKITKALLNKRLKRQQKREFKEKLRIWKESVILRDNGACQMCGKKLLTRKEQHPHHILALQWVIRKAPGLLEDINNGITLCAYCHKFSPESPHQNAFYFIWWLKFNKPLQFTYLTDYLSFYGKK